MKLTLYYRGFLPSNGRPPVKQAIREAFDPQIKKLFTQAPLADQAASLLYRDPASGPNNLLFTQSGSTFAALVSSRFHVTAEISVTMLRPETPGSLLAGAGDIDNRLKTLLDALTIPRDPSQLPDSFVPRDDSDPFFCLLEDDSLVTSLSVHTKQWLDAAAAESNHVVLLIDVETSTTAKTMNNFSFD